MINFPVERSFALWQEMSVLWFHCLFLEGPGSENMNYLQESCSIGIWQIVCASSWGGHHAFEPNFLSWSVCIDHLFTQQKQRGTDEVCKAVPRWEALSLPKGSVSHSLIPSGHGHVYLTFLLQEDHAERRGGLLWWLRGCLWSRPPGRQSELPHTNKSISVPTCSFFFLNKPSDGVIEQICVLECKTTLGMLQPSLEKVNHIMFLCEQVLRSNDFQDHITLL